MKKTKEQKNNYAMRRLSIAIDRMIIAKTPEEKEQAKSWARAWELKVNAKPFSL